MLAVYTKHMNIAETYNKYFVERSFERRDLLEKLVKKYGIKSCLYPGSHVHVTPSFYIPRVVYVDSDTKTKKIFANIEEVIAFIARRKVYRQEALYDFFGQSYSKPLPIDEQFDFLFSQYAGPISQDCKRYLKKGGILVANNSHADAGLAALDPDYELIAVANNRGAKVSISEKNLDHYFVPKKESLSLSELRALGKGVGYTKTADNYIFKKVN